MRCRLALVAVLLAALVVPVSSAGSPGLKTTLTNVLRAPTLSLARTAAIAVDTTTGEVLFAHNASVSVVPASNEKLPVSWAALTRLGSEYRFHTELRGVGSRAGSSWNGDLVLVGYGDPTLATSDLAVLARTVRARGIKRVTGRILGDESAFDAKRDAPGWKASFLGGETPPLSALVVDRARGWPKNSPPVLAARWLREALIAQGVRVDGDAWLGSAPVESFVLARDWSASLASIVKRMNRDSDNFLAEMLLKHLGSTGGVRGSTVGGAQVVLEEMRAARIPTAGVRIVDGSGLSRLDRVTAVALVGVIRAGLENPRIRSAFVSSLAVAGRSGTLDDRLLSLTGAVVGKTGTTSLACTLSGLVRGSIAFAVLQNGDPVSYWSARSAQDRFVLALAQRTSGSS